MQYFKSKQFSTHSVRKKIYFLVGFSLLFLFIELATLSGTMYLISAMRAYVNGESIWSKAQKNALIYLVNYAQFNNPHDYALFLKEMNIILADKNARLAMDANSSRESISLYFLAGNNDPSDIPRMINLYRYFKHVYYMNRAINIWQEGDLLAEKILQIAQKIHQKILAKKNLDSEYVSQIADLNNQLTLLEYHFSMTLGEASRWLEYLVLTLLFCILILFSFCTLGIATYILINVTTRIRQLIRISKEVRNNNFSVRINDDHQDELGQLASAFNKMVITLDTNKDAKIIAEGKLKESEERFRQAFDYAPIGMAIVLPEGTWLKVNQVLCEILGYTADELYKMNFQQITYAQDLEKDLSNVERLIKGEILSYHLEKRYVRKDNSIIWVLLSVSLIRDTQTFLPLHFIAQIQNIDQQKKITEQLNEMAFLDSLTDLHNRRALHDRFELLKKLADTNQSGFVLCYLDVDFFKRINDIYGHIVGDHVLKTIGDRLNQNLWNNDFAARIGGDEFIIILSNLNYPDLKKATAELILALKEPMYIKGLKLNVSISLGTSYYPEDGTTLEQLLQVADAKLYDVKQHRIEKL